MQSGESLLPFKATLPPWHWQGPPASFPCPAWLQEAQLTVMLHPQDQGVTGVGFTPPSPLFGVGRWVGGWQEAVAAEVEAAWHKCAGGSSRTTNATVGPSPRASEAGGEEGTHISPQTDKGAPSSPTTRAELSWGWWQLLPGMWGRGWLAPGTAELQFQSHRELLRRAELYLGEQNGSWGGSSS